MDDPRKLTDDELGRVIDSIEENIGEMRAEIGAETAMFGDAWPGAQLDLADRYEALRPLKAEAARRKALRPKPPRTVPLTLYEPDNMIPF